MNDTLAVFDMDGTLTYQDTFSAFLKFTHGRFKFSFLFTLLSPFVFLKRMGWLSNSQLTEIILTAFYKGYPYSRLSALGNEFAEKVLPALLRKDIYEKLLWHKDNGHRVMVLTASCDIWLRAWCLKEQVELEASQLEIKNWLVTGKLNIPYCCGMEKRKRLERSVNMKSISYMYAYGNHPDDRFYMNMANEKHWVIEY